MTIDTLPVGAYPTASVERLVGACEAIKAVAQSWLEQLELEPEDLVRLNAAADAVEAAWAQLSPRL
ncbi:MAG TPA: hypothetical protein VFA83_07755 [Acidimicrobiales bacterium]|nr:hypothetical protein [Acidimicrobiales bacterium]